MGRTFRLAIGQSSAALPTPQDRLDWLAETLPEIASQNADLLLLPELFATGYNIGNQIAARSERADGPTSQIVAALAKAHNVAIHYGFVEEDAGETFNAAQCFGPDGKRLGGHRKLAIPPGFERVHFASGQNCTLFTYQDARIATLICYDVEFPETARYVASLGAEIILADCAT